MKKQNGLAIVTYFQIISVILVFCLTVSCASSINMPVCKKGVLDASLWDFDSKTGLRLDGMWEFYPDTLLTPADFKEKDTIPQPCYIKVPGLWEKKGKNGQKMTPRGYATYRLRIKMGPGWQENLGIKIPRIPSAYILWINGDLVESMGIPGKSREKSVPKQRPADKYFSVTTSTIEIVIQVANYDDNRGGIWESLVLGNEEPLHFISHIEIGVDLFLLGILLIMSFYHLFFFLFRSSDKSTLYFSLLCLTVALRVALTGETILIYFFPRFPWHLANMIEYCTVIAQSSFILAFFCVVFKELIYKPLYYILEVIYFLLVLTIMITPNWVNNLLLRPYMVVTILLFVFVLYVLIKGIKRKQSAAFIFLFSCCVLFATGISDMTRAQQLHYGPFVYPYGVLIFIFCQAIIISRRMVKAFHVLENFSRMMEEQVSKRTLEVTEKNRTIMESIEYAQTIQLSILPPGEVIKKWTGDFFVLWSPRDIVGGDVYVFKEYKNAFLLGLFDCTGHGVPGALMTMTVNSILTNITEHICRDDPAKILHILNIRLRNTLYRNSRKSLSNDGLDAGIVYCIPGENKLVFAGARISLFFQQGQIVKEIVGNRRSIGYIDSSEEYLYENHIINPGPKSRLFLTTDGFVDQCGGEKGFPMGKSAFKKILSGNSKKDFNQLKDIINSSLDTYMKRGSTFPQLDDITIIGFSL